VDIPVDFVLIGITVLVAVAGALWDKPGFWVKCGLIALALAAGFGSVYKHYQDEADKAFLQTALISTLHPSNAEYQKFYGDLTKVVFPSDQQDVEYDCHHSDDGLTCFLGSREQVAVFNRADVASMYANVIRGMSNQGAIKAVLDKKFESDSDYEDLLDKIGILGMHTYYNVFDQFPNGYVYDPKFGVKVALPADKTVQINPKEIAEAKKDKTAGAIFRAVEILYRQRFASDQPISNRAAPDQLRHEQRSQP
jgi:hypothetical protein